jgi:DNA polymerase-3 subunit beta
MKFRFNRQEMNEALSAVCSVAAVRTPKEILRCVRLEAHTDVLLLSATDLEVSLRFAVTQVEVDDPGDVVVSAETLSRIVRECTDDALAAELDGSKLHLRGTGSHFQIITHDVADFPPVATLDGDPDVRVGFGVLRRLVELTAFAAARESTRYAIHGVLWEVDQQKLTLAATDGRRLALGHGALLDEGGTRTLQAIVPPKALSLFSRVPAEDDTPVGVKITGNQLVLDMGKAVVGTALAEGQFPKYQDVVPTDCDRVVELNTSEFHGALKRASLLTNEESKGVRFSFAPGSLTLSSRAPEQGEAEVALPVAYEGEPMEIGFNPVFLLELLRVAHTEVVTFAFRESNRPGVLRVGDSFLYVVMPVNLSSA